MDDLLQEYKDYYRARVKRYTSSSKYPHTRHAEEALCGAMEGCQTLEEFKDRIGDKNEKVAVALVKDQETIRKEGYHQLQEPIRAKASERILAQADQANTAQEIITLVMEETNKNSVEISMDEAVRVFNDWKVLEDHRISTEAEVPDKWKAKQQQSAQDAAMSVMHTYEDLEKNNDSWESGWKMNFDLINEPRHRRFLPVPDEVVQARIQQTKNILGR